MSSGLNKLKRMLTDKHEKRYKEYLATEKRYNEIWQQLRNRPLVKLKEPFQKGWEIYLDLREDIKNRVDYSSIKAAFDLVSSSVTTRNVSLIRRIRSNGRYDKIQSENHLGNYKYRWAHLPSLSGIREDRTQKLSPDVKRWFSLDSYAEKWASFRGHWYYLDIPQYWIEMKVRPNIMTHQYLKGGDLEKEYEFLKSKLSLYWIEYATNYSSSYPAYKDRAKMRAKIQKFKKGEIEDIVVEKIPKEYDW